MRNKRIKSGGRKPGTPNRRTIEAIETFGEFCPLEEILEILETEVIENELRINTCLKLMKFKFPERKAIEHNFDPSGMSQEELVSETKMLLKSLEKEDV